MNPDPVVAPPPLMLVLAPGPIAEALVRVGQAMDMQVDVVDQASAEARAGIRSRGGSGLARL